MMARPRKLNISTAPVEEEEVDQGLEKVVEEAVEEVVEPVREDLARRDVRPAIREEDPRTRAARRAAEIRNHINVDDDGVDEFFIDPAVIPPGWSYEWKRRTVMNEENAAYQVQLQLKGWEPVPSTRHPEYMPDNGRFATIERKGMVLMERPLEITEASRQAEHRKARLQVRSKEEQLNAAPGGTFERSNKDAGMAKVSKSYEPIPIPND
jgi:hypothetical protein